VYLSGIVIQTFPATPGDLLVLNDWQHRFKVEKDAVESAGVVGVTCLTERNRIWRRSSLSFAGTHQVSLFRQRVMEFRKGGSLL
jgi:hypothetical protein